MALFLVVYQFSVKPQQALRQDCSPTRFQGRRPLEKFHHLELRLRSPTCLQKYGFTRSHQFRAFLRYLHTIFHNVPILTTSTQYNQSQSAATSVKYVVLNLLFTLYFYSRLATKHTHCHSDPAELRPSCQVNRGAMSRDFRSITLSPATKRVDLRFHLKTDAYNSKSNYNKTQTQF